MAKNKFGGLEDGEYYWIKPNVDVSEWEICLMECDKIKFVYHAIGWEKTFEITHKTVIGDKIERFVG